MASLEKRLYLSSLKSEKGKISLQILSDLHLELDNQYSTFDFPARAPYLILAGDIGRISADYSAYLTFLVSKCCNRFDRVFLVLGNHEFYNSSHAEVLDLALTKLEHEPLLKGRLTVLHRRRVDLEDEVTILGCTLWSHIFSGSAREAVESRVKDFKRIDGWSVDQHNAEHEADVRWLNEQVALIRSEERDEAEKRGEAPRRQRRVAVVTHHAPCMKGSSDPRHANNAWNSAFATDLLPENAGSADAAPLLDVQFWVFGHTHFSTEFERGGVRVVSNQRGYALPGTIDEDRLDAERSGIIASSGKAPPPNTAVESGKEKFRTDKVIVV